MKRVKRIVLWFIAGLATAGLLWGLTGCSEHSPNGPGLFEDRSKIARDSIELISWRSSRQSLNKIHTVSELIRKADGGKISLEMTASENPDGISLSVSLTVPPEALDADMKDISFTLDDSNIDLAFGPSGTHFTPYALLNLTASGLDLTGVDPEAVELYYDNTTTGKWELIPREDIIVIPKRGYIQVINARLPHFSRYAMSKG